MECRLCREEIKDGALKCIECGAFQDWRRYLSLSNTTLALIIALITTISAAGPKVIQMFGLDDADFVVGVPVVSLPILDVIVTNDGKRSGIANGATILVPIEHLNFAGENIDRPGETPVSEEYGTHLRLEFDLSTSIEKKYFTPTQSRTLTLQMRNNIEFLNSDSADGKFEMNFTTARGKFQLIARPLTNTDRAATFINLCDAMLNGDLVRPEISADYLYDRISCGSVGR